MSNTFPTTQINIVARELGNFVAPQRILLIGQKTSVGTAPSGQLVQNIPFDLSENTLFGENSMLAAMVRSFKQLNNDSILDAIPLDDPSGAAATATVDFATGSSTAGEDGTYTVSVGSFLNNTYSIAVSSGDTPTMIGDALVSAITADTKSTVTASNLAGIVTLTAVHIGTEANTIGISILGNISGIVVTLTAMSGGTGVPTLTGLFDPIESIRYQTFCWPSSYDLSVITTELDDVRYNATNQIMDGRAITAFTGDFSDCSTLASSQDSRNLVVLVNKLYEVDTVNQQTSAPSVFELDYVISSQFCANRSLRLNDTSDISNIVIAPLDSNDRVGGFRISGLPYFNTPFYNLPLPVTGSNWIDSERSSLNTVGGSIFVANDFNTLTVLSQVVTTYKTNDLHVPDTTYLYLNNVDVTSSIREVYFNSIKTTYPQYRLTTGVLPPGANITNQTSIESFIDSVYKTLAGQDYVLTVDGPEALTFFKNNRSVSVDPTVGSATISMKVPIISQLRQFIINIEALQINFGS